MDQTPLKRATKDIEEKVYALLKRKKEVTIGLPGGRSVLPLLKELKKKHLSWERMRFFQIDERLVEPESEEANQNTIRKHLPQTAQFFAVDLRLRPKDAKRDYEQRLRKKHADILILSVGEDGHIASLFPHHAALRKKGHYTLIEDSPKEPRKRITLTKGEITAAKHAYLLFLGKEKRRVYKQFMDPTTKVQDCPAVLAKAIKNLTVVVE